MMTKLFTTTLLTSFYLTASASSLRGNDDERQLQDTTVASAQACSAKVFAKKVGGKATLASMIGSETNTLSSLNTILKSACNTALEPTLDLSEALGKGPQYLKNFLDGGTTWNDNYETDDGDYNLHDDTQAIRDVAQSTMRTTVFSTPDGGTSETYPQYFSNFFRGDQECPLGVIECCYTESRLDPIQGNAEMCALDMTPAAKSNHIKMKSYTFYDTQPSDQTYCTGFAYDKDSTEDKVKYNTLFYLAMKKNLHDNGLVKNIPGAPMCGCVEQMPIVTKADCVKPVVKYNLSDDGEVSITMNWTDCGTDLYSYYESLSGRSDIEKSFVKSKIVGEGQCAAAAASFMNDRMYKSKS